MSTVVTTRSRPGCLLQIIWFVLVGWWLGEIAVAAAYACFVTVIGIPIGVIIVNNLPTIIALRPAAERVQITATADGRTYVSGRGADQLPLLLRAIWFIFVGWWLTAAWLQAAYLLCVTVIGLPLGFWMFDLAPALLTLHRD
jgi:uncharacterized membrane protein YccF (DUF307 family)